MSPPEPHVNEPQYHYAGFISYAHADEAWARWLHRALEAYRLPRQLARKMLKQGMPARLRPVFRDRDELPSSSDLGGKLRGALASSRALIVLCSPHSAQSRWVNEEIREFQAQGRSDRIFCMIVAGEPHSSDPAQDCFPPSLTGEPLACDARKDRDGKLNALLKLVAGIVGVNFDELKRRDRSRRIRRRIVVSAATAVLLIGAVTLGNYARNQERIAESRTLAAASMQATNQDLDPVTGLERAIQASAVAHTDEAAAALAAALRHQNSLVIFTHSAKVLDAEFSPDARQIVTCGVDAKARLWDVDTGKVIHEFSGHSKEVRICSLSPDGSALLTVDDANEPRVWNTRSGQLSARLTGHSGAVRTARFSSDGALAVTASMDKTVRVWDTKTGELRVTLTISNDEAAVSAFLIKKDSLVLAVSEHGVCSLWDWTAGRRLKEFGDRLTWVNEAVVSPKGTRFLISNYQYRPYLYMLPGADFINGAMALNHTIGAAFSHDDAILVLGGADGSATVWDTERGFHIKELVHPDLVDSVAISPDGKLVATGADRIRIWHMPVLGGGVDQELGILRGHKGAARVVMFAPNDSSRLLTIGDDDQSVRVWDVSPLTSNASQRPPTVPSFGELLRQAEARLPIRGSDAQ
jgi:WD40 repeat protein